MSRFIRKMAVVLVVVLIVAACLPVALAEQSLASAIGSKNKIALFVPLTGEQKQYGDAISTGLKMRVDAFNTQYGTNFVVDIYDDKGDSTEAANIAYKIISDSSVFCAMGSYSSSCVLAAAPIFQEAGLLFLSPGASHPDVPKVGDHIFTYGINIVFEMQATMQSISTRFNNPPLAIIYQATDHGVQTYETTASYYPSLGGTVVAAETFVPDTTTDFKSIISKVKDAGAKVVFLSTTYADGAQIILQANDLDCDFQWVGNSQLMQEEFMDLVGDLGEGLFASSNMPVYLKSTLENEAARASLGEVQIDFIGRYMEYCGMNPNGFSCLGYDSVSILLDAVSAAMSTDTDDLIPVLPDAFLNAKGLLCGDVTEYNAEERTLIREVNMYQIIDGCFQLAPSIQ